jgi:hypothetical protein
VVAVVVLAVLMRDYPAVQEVAEVVPALANVAVQVFNLVKILAF